MVFSAQLGVYDIGDSRWYGPLPRSLSNQRAGMDATPRTDQISLVIPAYNEGEVIAQAVA